MFELLAILGLVLVGLAVVALFAAVGLVVKVAFKILLLPFTLLFALFKIVLVAGLMVVALAAAPIVFAVLLALAVVALPLLLVGGLVGVGWALAT